LRRREQWPLHQSRPCLHHSALTAQRRSHARSHASLPLASGSKSVLLFVWCRCRSSCWFHKYGRCCVMAYTIDMLWVWHAPVTALFSPWPGLTVHSYSDYCVTLQVQVVVQYAAVRDVGSTSRQVLPLAHRPTPAHLVGHPSRDLPAVKVGCYCCGRATFCLEQEQVGAFTKPSLLAKMAAVHRRPQAHCTGPGSSTDTESDWHVGLAYNGRATCIDEVSLTSVQQAGWQPRVSAACMQVVRQGKAHSLGHVPWTRLRG
jgi:hypothetical protein